MTNKYRINPDEDAILPNKLGLTAIDLINEEEFIGFAGAEERALEHLNQNTLFSLQYVYDLHYDALHHVYDFAGKLRTVNMSKGEFAFPAAQYLPQNMLAFSASFLDPLNENELDDEMMRNHIAALHAELLFIHPFREGNGRVIRLFTRLVSLAKRERDIDFTLITQGDNFARYVQAVQQSAQGEYALMQRLFAELEA